MLGTKGADALQGTALVAAITSVCSAGFLLFGYDQGVMSGVVISDFWLDQMGNPTPLIVGTLTSLYDVGAVIGAVCAAFTSEPMGRKRTLMLGAALIVVGSALMGSSFGQAQFMVARILTGMGIGYLTSVAPVYQAEVSKAAHRGWLVCCQLSTLLFGLMLAYWIDYGMFFHQSSAQWRFPLLFQLVFALYILALTPFLPDSPRWLMRHHRPEDALSVLAQLRGRPEADEMVRKEEAAIAEAIRVESAEEGSWMDLFRSNGVHTDKRFYLALGIQFMQQMSGINIVTYYSPTLFKTSLKMSQQTSILMGCLLQLWYLCASFLTWYMIDRVGRRKLFIVTAFGMCAVLVAEAVSVNINMGNPDNTGSAISAVFWVFAFEACFTWGWMATVWVYPPEILPLKIRAKGAALAAAADFLGNFIVVEVTPYGLDNIGWKFYLVWAVLNFVDAIIVWLFYPETAGQPLEAIDNIFIESENDTLGAGSQIAGARKKGRLGRLQWSVISKADAQIKWYKQHGQPETAVAHLDSKRGARDETVEGEATNEEADGDGQESPSGAKEMEKEQVS